MSQYTIAAVGKLRTNTQSELINSVANSNKFEAIISFPTTYNMDRDLLIIENRPHVVTIAKGVASTSRDIPYDDIQSVADEAN